MLPSSEKEWKVIFAWMLNLLPNATSNDDPQKRLCINCGNPLTSCQLTNSDSTHEDTNVSLTPCVKDFSQPECDWTVVEPFGRSSQSGTAIDRVLRENEQGVQIGQSESILDSRNSLETRNSQPESLLDSRRGAETLNSQSNAKLDKVNKAMSENSSQPNLIKGELQEIGGQRLLQDSNTSGKESDWLPTVTWQRVALLLVGQLGALNGVKLLGEVSIPEGALGRRFHQLCILSSIWKKQQRYVNYKCTTFAPTTIAPMINANVKYNPNSKPIMNPYLTSNQKSNYYPHSNSLLSEISLQEQLSLEQMLDHHELQIFSVYD